MSTKEKSPHILMLESLQEMTVEELRAAMGRISPEVRSILALGPARPRYDCGVCNAFGKDCYKNIKPDLDDPMYLVWAYHEVPKIHMDRASDQWYGVLSNEVYIRCIETYRAAGWTGEAEEPNA